LEWVCKLQIHACVRDVFPLYFDTGVLGSPDIYIISPFAIFCISLISLQV
jgi:hypothetical protein